LIVGAVLNLALLLMIPSAGGWGSVEREFRIAFTASSLAAVAIVCVVPVLWRAKDPQRVLALILLVLPCLTFWVVWKLKMTSG
jgi:hypothetical protein